jgi:hypothetical protein
MVDSEPRRLRCHRGEGAAPCGCAVFIRVRGSQVSNAVGPRPRIRVDLGIPCGARRMKDECDNISITHRE